MTVVIAAEDQQETNELPLHTVETTPEANTAGENLTKEKQQELQKLLEKYHGTFNDLPRHTQLVEHSINTGTTQLLNQPPYCIPIAWQKEVQEEIQQLLALGVIR